MKTINMEDIEITVTANLRIDQLAVLEKFRHDKLDKFERDLQENPDNMTADELKFFIPLSIKRYEEMSYDDLLFAFLTHVRLDQKNV